LNQIVKISHLDVVIGARRNARVVACTLVCILNNSASIAIATLIVVAPSGAKRIGASLGQLMCKDIDDSINASIPVGGIGLRNAAGTSGGWNSDPSILVVTKVRVIATEGSAEPVIRYITVGRKV
jgi:hypothetical protein